jgi:hypothetical protein
MRTWSYFLWRQGKIPDEHISSDVTDEVYRWVQTEMGRGAATAVGMADAPVTQDESVDGLTKVVSLEFSLNAQNCS